MSYVSYFGFLIPILTVLVIIFIDTSFSPRGPSLLMWLRKFSFVSFMLFVFYFIRSNREKEIQNIKPNFEFTTVLSRRSNNRSSKICFIQLLPSAFLLAIISLLVMSENPSTNNNTESNLSEQQQQQPSGRRFLLEEVDSEFPPLSNSQVQEPRRVTVDPPETPGATVNRRRDTGAATPGLLQSTSSSDSNDSQRSYSEVVTVEID